MGLAGRPIAALLVLLAACSSLDPLSEPVTETVTVKTIDLPGRLWDPFMPDLSEGTEVIVEGKLTIPATAEPVPAVIVTHGCGGVGGAERSWVRDLTDLRIAILVMDSFGGRGISSVCSGEETINVASVLVDVYRAQDVLAKHPYVDASRIALMGMSFGGRAALWAAMNRFQEKYDGDPFSAYIAFYPSTCFIRLEDEHLVTDGPIRIFHGTADDWTPIEQCSDYVERVSALGVDAAIFPYDGAHHAFDDLTLGFGVGYVEAPSPRNCSFVERDGAIIDPAINDVAGVGSPCVELGVHYGFDADARKAAVRDLTNLLMDVFEK